MSPVDGVRHLYVHMPFCAHRCGYCDFVTVVGRASEHGAYVDALLAELAREQHLLADRLETVFVGGGTPTFTELAALHRLLDGLPPASETTIEANPETVTPELAHALRLHGVDRVSLGAQTFHPALLAVLERVAGPDDVRRAVHHLRDAGIDNISLDLVYGIPGQSPADLDADLDAVLALDPEHVSAYELEAKPGTRFTLRHGEALQRQADALEGYFEAVVDRLEAAGYRWYETANFARLRERSGQSGTSGPSGGVDRRAQHNLAYWRGADYLGVGIGAVSTLGSVRRRTLPALARYRAAVVEGQPAPHDVERLDGATRRVERLLLGLRLEEGVPLADVEGVLDDAALERMCARGMATVADGVLRLTRRGRFVGGAVTAELLASA